MAVDANQNQEAEERMKKIMRTCTGAQSACLGYDEAGQLLERRLLPQTKYGLHLSQFSPKECHPMTVMINETFLPILHVHRRMKREVVWGPVSMGGLGLNTNIYSLQCQCAAMYLVRTIRWDKAVAQDIITTLNAFQRASGFLTPVLEDTSIPIKYLGRGWIPNLREMMREIGAGVWIEKIWRPKKQRQFDTGIMETFAAAPDITPLTRELANEVRMWMGVTCMSELADISGRVIPIERIRNGSEWRATPETGYSWPNTVEPTDRHRAAFRKCLRLTYCSTANPYSRHDDYELDQPLGKWYAVRRHIQFEAYRTKEMVLFRDEGGLHPCKEREGQAGFFDVQAKVMPHPPLKSNPIEPNMVSPGVLWTRKPRRLVKPRSLVGIPEITGDGIPGNVEADTLNVMSDAAVHVENAAGAAAWQIRLEDGRKYTA
jgi:hypothetical protein